MRQIGNWENVIDRPGNRVPCSVSVSCVRCCGREIFLLRKSVFGFHVLLMLLLLHGQSCGSKRKSRIASEDKGMKIHLQTSPRNSHPSNGGAQRVVHTVRGLSRTCMLLFETESRLTVKSGAPLWVGLVRCDTQRGLLLVSV